jgi:ligand-binding sensor domain-containing protein
MALNTKSVAVIAVVVAAVGIYVLSTRHEAPAQAGKAAPLPPGATMPAGHPPINAAAQAAASAPQAQVGQQNPDSGTSGSAPEDPNARFTHFRTGNSNVKSIYVDGKIVWVATSAGVIRYDTSSDQFRVYDVTNGSGLISNGVFYIGKLGDRVVAGTYGGGMSLLDPATDKWENINVPNGLADAFVYRVLKASNGDIWIATWSGANLIHGGDLHDRSKWEVYTVESTHGGLPNDWVYSVAEGKDGEIWFATEGGPARFKDGKWQHWKVGAPYSKIKNDPKFGIDPSKLSQHHAEQARQMGLQGLSGAGAYNPNYIVALQIDPDGVVWCGTWGGGLSRYADGKWTNYTMSDGLPGNLVFMLHRDPTGKLWIGTNNGIAVLDNTTFDRDKIKVLTTKDGLFANIAFSMATAPDGSKWIGSFGGVTHLK